MSVFVILQRGNCTKTEPVANQLSPGPAGFAVKYLSPVAAGFFSVYRLWFMICGTKGFGWLVCLPGTVNTHTSTRLKK